MVSTKARGSSRPLNTACDEFQATPLVTLAQFPEKGRF